MRPSLEPITEVCVLAIVQLYDQWYVVPAAAHYDLWATGGLKYEVTIEQFLTESISH